ncbi:hypothetical protein NQ318_001669 [Aromia moschata]|uniref:Sushi domain-containing protein n=1 Tax=Aromia moschata TaxID=1265417 RepID=A0AAV8XH20_9CUCU|nr:hypothetical protein NQ318_001669 [Aromia moschata]
MQRGGLGEYGNGLKKWDSDQIHRTYQGGIECGEVGGVQGDHLKVLVVSREVGGKAIFSCDAGYGLRGPAETVCQASGDWASPFPTCEDSIEIRTKNYVVSLRSSSFRRRPIICYFILYFDSMDYTNIQCVSKVPGRLDNSRNMTFIKVGGFFPENPMVTLDLTLTMTLKGRAVWECHQVNATNSNRISVNWVTEHAQCKGNKESVKLGRREAKVHCDNPTPPENGYIQGNGPYKAGDVVQFNCNQDYMMEGQPIIACQENSRWSGKLPKWLNRFRFYEPKSPRGDLSCILSVANLSLPLAAECAVDNCVGQNLKLCPDLISVVAAVNASRSVQACSYPGTTISGRMSSVKFYYKIGENITFTCEEGLQLRGAAMLKCLKNGKWSNAIPTCVVENSEKN